MRRALLPLIAALVLLPGCHELWGASPTYGQSGTDGSASEAQANVRASIPAIEAYYADNGTYAGMTVEQLRGVYDYGIPDVRIVRATRKTYCVESTVGDETASYHGPARGLAAGGC